MIFIFLIFIFDFLFLKIQEHKIQKGCFLDEINQFSERSERIIENLQGSFRSLTFENK